MKKFIAILSLLIITFGSKIVTLAAPDDPNGWQTDPVISALMEVIPENTGKNPDNTFYEKLWQNGYNPQDNYKVLLYNMSGNLWAYVSPNLVLNDTSVTIPSGCVYVNYSVTLNESFVYTQSNSYTTQLSNEFQWIGSYTDAIEMDDDIDYTLPIPRAKLVTAGETTGTMENPVNNFKLMIDTPNFDLTGLYVEVTAKYYSPSKVYISTYMWNKSEYTVGEYSISGQDNIVALANRTRLIDLTPNTQTEYRWQVDLNVNNGWYNFMRTKTANYPDFLWASSGDYVQQGEALNAIGKYNSQMYSLPGSYNMIELFIRYFRIDGASIKVGQWLHLRNNTVLDNDAINVSIPVSNPPIEQDTSPVVNLPDDTNSITTGVWLPTYNPDEVNVVINNNMPEQNTLNYPTIVSYNHDIAFKQYAETARNIPDFFTNVTNFAVMAFSFIPAEVWAIISMGLLLSIAVMVIKIL